MSYYNPIFIEKFNIYDIFHNDNNELIIITPYITIPYTINYISSEKNILPFNLYKCPHNHTYIYIPKVLINEVLY